MSETDAIDPNGERWADPSALGLAPLVGINLAFAGDFLGWWGSGAAPLIAVVGFVGGLLQLLTGVLSLKRGDAAGGTLMGTFGMLFMWGPGFMLVANEVGLAGGLNPFFGTWSLFLGALLGMWSLALLQKPWFEFLIGPLGFFALGSAGMHDLGLLPAVIPGIGFLALLGWGAYMLAHALAAASGLSIPLGRPAMELFAGQADDVASTQVSRSD
ncbi:hypothetical protein HSBGL_1183 [Halapricum desulfuricans]|uniref:GPR1/FUN34/yaaH family protein n=1 Tax=Halapricum desulfuricans TaxID=2841257 RepID=A0A897NFX9_9EURY|nr:hypothetical protein [Halapricum desulfuricans]QSG11607.1 hypothetical protein HSBGL_1183 [Halapricum desulfuricans]